MSEKAKKILTAAAFLLAIVFTAVICVYIGKPLIKFVSDPEQFRDWVDSHGFFSRIAFIGMVIFQVIIAVVPGEPFEIGAGYAFGTVEGTILVMIGITAGSAIIFALVRTLGVRMVEVFFPVEKIRSLKFLKNTKKLNLITFIVFLLPGTPKDLLSYFIGLTDINFGYWLFVASVARLPSVITSTAAGDALGIKKYKLAVIFLVSSLVISGIGLIYYRRISKKEEKAAQESKKDSQTD